MRQTNYVKLVRKGVKAMSKLGINKELLSKWSDECLGQYCDYSEGYPVYHNNVIDTLFVARCDYTNEHTYKVNRYMFQDYLYCRDFDSMFTNGYTSGYLLIDLGCTGIGNEKHGIILTEQCYDNYSGVIKRGDTATATGIYFKTDEKHNMIFKCSCKVDLKLLSENQIQIINI